MFSEIMNWGMKKWISFLIVLLFITDIIVLLDIPVFRELSVFIYFTTVPGILILHIFKLNKLNFLKKVVLLIGLSISFITFTGLLLNSLYPLLLKPLSLAPLLILFNILLIIMAVIAYWRNKENFYLKDFLNFNANLNGKLTSILIFPAIFPFMAILGTYLMNTSENNIILLSMLMLIPVYIIVLALFKEKVHPATYPFSLWTIGLGLLLIYGLTSQHIIGRDVHNELYCLKLTLANFHWNIMDYFNPYNACLSITILPAIYTVLSSLNAEYVFKIYFAVIGSFIPLIIYIVAKNYLDEQYAFFASLLFVFQLFFMNLLGAIRQEVAVLFFFLALMVIFSTDINKQFQKVMFLIFLFSLVVSHYTTAYVAFIIMATILLVPFLTSLIRKRKIVFTNFDLILISLAFIGLWYILFAKVQFASGTQVVQTTVAATAAGLGDASTPASAFADSRGDYVLGILGIKLKSVPNTISVIAHNLTFATILIGLLAIGRHFKHYLTKFGAEFLVGVVLSIALMVSFVVLPYISVAYDVARLFFQLIIFLAPVFIIGAIAIAKLIKKPKWSVAIILILLIFLFSCTTYLQYHFYGMPYSATYDKDGIIRGETFIYQSELAGVYWLKENRINNLSIYSDERIGSRFNIADFRPKNANSSFFIYNKTVSSGYIYLGKVNIDKKQIYQIYDDILILDLNNYKHLFIRKERIYDSGGSQIWF
ncbi:MAG: DUF2206 domain-containing protein [Methanobacterium sp.]|jgi:uncharacterized membrane protein